MKSKLRVNNNLYFDKNNHYIYGKLLYNNLKKYHLEIFLFNTVSFNTDNKNSNYSLYNYIIPQFYYAILYNPINKFIVLKNQILNNNFLTEEQKNYVLNIFSKTQKEYLTLVRFVYLYKIKNLKKYDFNSDLMFNDLDRLSKNIKIELIENNIIYTFRLSDLNNLIYKSLTHNYQLITETHHIRNPFTNIDFSFHNLYNIYLKLKKSNFKCNKFFESYIYNEFDLKKYEIDNLCILREIAIDEYFNSLTEKKMTNEIIRMLSSNRNTITQRIYIHKDFPRNILNQTFKQYLYEYYILSFSYNPEKRYYAGIKFKKIKQFFRNHPHFGKKIKKTENYNLNFLENNVIINNNDSFITTQDIKTLNDTVEFDFNRYRNNLIYKYENFYSDYDSDFDDDNEYFDDNNNDDDELNEEDEVVENNEFIENNQNNINDEVSESNIPNQGNENVEHSEIETSTSSNEINYISQSNNNIINSNINSNVNITNNELSNYQIANHVYLQDQNISNIESIDTIDTIDTSFTVDFSNIQDLILEIVGVNINDV